MTSLNLPKPDNQAILSFVRSASEMDVSARLEYFYNLFPYAELIPANLYIQDHDGRTIVCNEHTWHSLKYDNFHAINGASILDTGAREGWPDDVAKKIRDNDIESMQGNVSVRSEITLEGDYERIWVARKEPIHHENGQAFALFGVSIPVELRHKKIKWLKKDNQVAVYLTPSNPVIFSPQEFIVLQNILIGKSAAEIAAQKMISSKTVETYIMRIKTKLSCDKQRDIISMMIQNNVASAIIEATRGPNV